MSLSTRKHLQAFILTELLINDQVIQRLNYLDTEKNQPEMTKGYPIFECILGIRITYKDDKTQNEDHEIASTHRYEDDYDITENGEEEKITKEETYDQEDQDNYPPDR